MYNFSSRINIALALLLSSLALGGCGKKIEIVQYPRFWNEDLKSIAVLPFRNATRNRNAGTVISENVARAMMQNNTYRVFSHNDLGALEQQRDLMIYADTGDAGQAAAKFRPGGKVQALLVGTVTTYAGTRNTQVRVDPVQQWDKRLKKMVVVGQRQYEYTRNEATVSVSAALIRVSDGTQIHATAEAVGRDACEGEVPVRDQHECLRRATDQAVRKLVEEFAVTRKTITFSDKNFRLAGENYDNKWAYADCFSSSQDKMYVVVFLPPSCDRNRFKITIVRQDAREDLAEMDVLWDGRWSKDGQGFEFSPAKIAQAGDGPGVFVAKFYSGPNVIATRTFKIEQGQAAGRKKKLKA